MSADGAEAPRPASSPPASSPPASSAPPRPARPRLTIRLARPQEASLVDAIVNAAYAHDYGAEGDHDDPARSAAHRATAFDVWIAFDADDRPVGSVTTRRVGGPPLHERVGDDELDLRLLAVAPTARRQRIGATILAHIIEHARDNGYAAVVLKTALHMQGPQRMYDALGFERVPERDGLWIDGRKVLDLYTYRYPL